MARVANTAVYNVTIQNGNVSLTMRKHVSCYNKLYHSHLTAHNKWNPSQPYITLLAKSLARKHLVPFL